MFFTGKENADMSNIKIPQVEYISGSTPQESTLMLNARIKELMRNNPSFERDGIAFWLTYIIDVTDEAEKPKTDKSAYCSGCPCFERVSDRAKWGKCQKHGGASVSCRKKVCDTYWILIEGGDEINA